MGRIEEKLIKVPYSKEDRKIRVYLPNNYDESKEKYPALYMHDGQNIFYDEESYLGISWGAKGALEDLERDGKEGIILVAIDNANERRVNEFSPLAVEDDFYGINLSKEDTCADKYLDFIVEDLIPFINSEYRTKRGRKNTWMAGSSSGACVTLYASIKYPLVFGKFGVFSPSTWEYSGKFKDLYEEYKGTNHEFYFYVGTEEGENNQRSHELSQAYLDAFLENIECLLANRAKSKLIKRRVSHKASHNEGAWRYVFPEMLNYFVEK